MIRVDKEEIKSKIAQKKDKQKKVMIKQYEEMEKMENMHKRDKNETNINLDFDNNNLNLKKNNESKQNENKINMIHQNIKLNYKFEMVKINKPIVFKTPSEKVVLLAERKKAVENRKDRLINGIKLENH